MPSTCRRCRGKWWGSGEPSRQESSNAPHPQPPQGEVARRHHEARPSRRWRRALSLGRVQRSPTGERVPTGARSWVFLYRSLSDKRPDDKRPGGKRKEIGLGSQRDVPLARARELAAEARRKLANGEDPKPGKEASGGDNSFAACAEHLMTSLRPSWRSDIHEKQWTRSLTKDAAKLASIPVDQITTQDVLSVLQPLWAKRVTAERLRGRIERVLDAARARGLIASPYENPARWRGHLGHILPKREQLERPHYAALPYDEVPAFLTGLRARNGIGAQALEFTILTAARTNEVLGARWDEIDLDEKTWTIPANV